MVKVTTKVERGSAEWNDVMNIAAAIAEHMTKEEIEVEGVGAFKASVDFFGFEHEMGSAPQSANLQFNVNVKSRA